MATGPVSSATIPQVAAPVQAATAPQVLRSGERMATSAAAIKNPSAKTYHHMVPGARFVMPDGLEIQFLGGSFTTADPQVIRELDAVANKASSMIFTEKANLQVAAAIVQQAAEGAAE